MASSLLPDFSSSGPSVSSMRLSEALLGARSQKPLGAGRLTATPPMLACPAKALAAAAVTRKAATVRRRSMGPPCVAGGEIRRPNRTGRLRQVNGGPSRVDRTEAVQGQLIIDVREYHLDARADDDRPAARIDEARGQARAFVEFDLRDVIRRLVGEGREPSLVYLRPRADAPAT